MCIIFYNETGKEYNKKELSVAYDNNPHGVGLMWVEDGDVQIMRGLYSKENLFKILETFKGVPHALHLRWRTRGTVNKNLCHPFRASHKNVSGKKVYLMHNGTIFNLPTGKNQSDTQVFAHHLRGITKQFGTDVLFHEKFLKSVEKDIKSFNKVILMRGDGNVAILNPEQWIVEDGMWYSNVYSLEPQYRSEQQVKMAARAVSSVFTKEKSETRERVSSKPRGGQSYISARHLTKEEREEQRALQKNAAQRRWDDLYNASQESRVVKRRWDPETNQYIYTQPKGS